MHTSKTKRKEAHTHTHTQAHYQHKHQNNRNSKSSGIHITLHHWAQFPNKKTWNNRIDEKRRPITLLYTRTYLSNKDRYYLRVKSRKKVSQANRPKKQPRVAITIFNKSRLSTKKKKEWKEMGNYTLYSSKGWLLILNICAPNAWPPSFIKEIWLKLKSHIKPHTFIVIEFNTPLSPMYRL